MTTSAVLFFAPQESHDSKEQQEKLLVQLQIYGFRAVVCETLSAVYLMMQRGIAPADAAGPALGIRVAILSGPSKDNLAMAASLRVLYPQLAIMAVVVAHDHTEAIQALHSGVDSVFSSDTPDQLRMAMLMALMRSRQIAPAAIEAQEEGLIGALDEAPWALQEKGWSLNSPRGIAVVLTTSERAVMLALLRAADRHVSRSELLRAIDGENASPAGPQASRRLGVIVSRMRRKFQEHGLELPLQAVHGAGYMFTAQLR
jgi:DNA-binding response OmpR family regulator